MGAGAGLVGEEGHPSHQLLLLYPGMAHFPACSPKARSSNDNHDNHHHHDSKLALKAECSSVTRPYVNHVTCTEADVPVPTLIPMPNPRSFLRVNPECRPHPHRRLPASLALGCSGLHERQARSTSGAPLAMMGGLVE